MDIYNLTIDAQALIEALKSHDHQAPSHLDLESGKVLRQAAPQSTASPSSKSPGEKRYLVIEPLPAQHAFGIMEDFIANLATPQQRQALERALRMSKPFRHFREELKQHPALQRAWETHEHQAYLHLAREWCESHRIHANWAPGAR